MQEELARLEKQEADLAHASRVLAEEEAHLAQARQDTELAVKAQAVVQVVAARVQQSVHEQVSKVVTRCLQAVGWDYEFRIVFEARRGKTEARLAFFRQGHEVDPRTAAGGGPLDVAALGLRLSCLMLARPRRRRLLVLDEPFKFVNGAKYQEAAGQLIEALARELNVQFVIATDDDWLKVGKVVEV